MQEVLFWTSISHFQILRSSHKSNISCTWPTSRILRIFQRPSHYLWKSDALIFHGSSMFLYRRLPTCCMKYDFTLLHDLVYSCTQYKQGLSPVHEGSRPSHNSENRMNYYTSNINSKMSWQRRHHHEFMTDLIRIRILCTKYKAIHWETGIFFLQSIYCKHWNN